MSKSKSQLSSEASRLRDKIAESEATLSGLKLKLAKIESQLNGDPKPVDEIEALWKEALPISRTRSSRYLCRKAWNRIPTGQRPPISDAVSALKSWNRCDEWSKDNHQYAIGLDRWITERRWESLPEVKAERDPHARYRSTPKPLPPPPSEDTPTDPLEIARLLSIHVKP